MVPARNLLRRHCDSYGGCYDHTQLEYYQGKYPLAIGYMAEEETRSGGTGGGGGGNGDEEGEEGEAGTSGAAVRGSVEQGGRRDVDGGGWLQLGIGVGSSSSSTTKPDSAQIDPSGQRRRTAGMMELDLFSERPSSSSDPRSSIIRPPLGPLPMAATAFGTTSTAAAAAAAMMPLFPAHPAPSLTYRGYRQDVTWGLWNIGPSSSVPLPPPYGSRQFMYMAGSSGSSSAEGGEPSSDVRVVSPPPRPQTGLWFFLQASQNQAREPFLPQIPKSYLRIRDGRMTIRLLMKYLVNKLGLDNESEVEITCRGQLLHHFLTLQHVRDNIWCSRDTVTMLPDSLSNHVMTLQYGRSASTSSSQPV